MSNPKGTLLADNTSTNTTDAVNQTEGVQSHGQGRMQFCAMDGQNDANSNSPQPDHEDPPMIKDGQRGYLRTDPFGNKYFDPIRPTNPNLNRMFGGSEPGYFYFLRREITGGVRGVGKSIAEIAKEAADEANASWYIVTGKEIYHGDLSNGMKALSSGNTSIGGYYGNLAANVFTGGIYGQVKAVSDYWHGKISIDQANEIVAGTAIMQAIAAATAVYSAAQTQSAINSRLASGAAEDVNGLSRAGRALEKHGSRPDSVFPKATGNAAAKNLAGQQVLKEILESNNQRITPNRFGGQDIFDMNTGRGVRYDSNGNMMGFLEP